MQQAALTFIVSQLLTKQDQDELRATFKAMDANSDGKITKDELFEGYKRIYVDMEADQIKKEVDKIFEMADMDGSGALDYNEWSIATLDMRGVLSDKRLREAFTMFDKVNFIYYGDRMVAAQSLQMRLKKFWGSAVK